jgi:hypothetical protein
VDAGAAWRTTKRPRVGDQGARNFSRARQTNDRRDLLAGFGCGRQFGAHDPGREPARLTSAPLSAGVMDGSARRMSGVSPSPAAPAAAKRPDSPIPLVA